MEDRDRNPFQNFNRDDTVSVVHHSEQAGRPLQRTGSVSGVSDGILEVNDEDDNTITVYLASMNVINKTGRSNYPLGDFLAAVKIGPEEKTDQPAEPVESESNEDPEPEPKDLDPLTENTPIRVGGSIGRIVEKKPESYTVRILLGDMMQHIQITHAYARTNVIDPDLQERD